MKPAKQPEAVIAVCQYCLQPEGKTPEMKYILCSGRCGRSFHCCCAGLQKVDPKWKCSDCARHQHECMICHKKGKEGDGLKGRKRQFTFYEQWLRFNDIASYINYFGSNLVLDSDRAKYQIPEPVVKCSQYNCGCFYHMSCVQNSHGFTKQEQHYCMFRCPRHHCVVCGGSSSSSAMLICVRCSRVYHANCLKDIKHRVLNKKFILCEEHMNEEPVEPKELRGRKNKKRSRRVEEMDSTHSAKRERITRERRSCVGSSQEKYGWKEDQKGDVENQKSQVQHTEMEMEDVEL